MAIDTLHDQVTDIPTDRAVMGTSCDGYDARFQAPTFQPAIQLALGALASRSERRFPTE